MTCNVMGAYTRHWESIKIIKLTLLQFGQVHDALGTLQREVHLVSKENKWLTKIKTFPFTSCLGFKTSLCVKHFIWKWVRFTWKWTSGGNTFSSESFHTKTWFGTGAKDNSKWPIVCLKMQSVLAKWRFKTLQVKVPWTVVTFGHLACSSSTHTTIITSSGLKWHQTNTVWPSRQNPTGKR